MGGVAEGKRPSVKTASQKCHALAWGLCVSGTWGAHHGRGSPGRSTGRQGGGRRLSPRRPAPRRGSGGRERPRRGGWPGLPGRQRGGAGPRPLSRSATPPQAGAGEGGRGAGASVPTATSRRCCLRDAPTSFRDFHDCICTFHACSGRSLRDQADFTSRDSREVTVSLHLAS